MHFRDISNDNATLYRLKKNEKAVFFMLNRSGDITFELSGKNAEAHVFAFFAGSDLGKKDLILSQRHLARETTSSACVKSALSGQSEVTCESNIFIAAAASLSNASFENRSLLLSPNAAAYSQPALEILAHDVQCHHAATATPLNPEALFFVTSRGLSPASAQKLLVHGFFQETLKQLEKLSGEAPHIEEKVTSLLA